jgi:hypothetical protein
MPRLSDPRLTAALAVTVALAASAQPASATTGWHFGPLVKTWINDCFTSDVVNGVGEYAGALYDADGPPKTGEVFYVNVVVSGIDASCAEITFPEIKLPPDMAPAITAANPILCYKVDNSTATETPDAADCPSSLGAALYGGTGSIRDPNGPAPGTWDTRAPNAWEFKIPVTASAAGLKDISFPTQVISGSITQMLEPDVSVPVDHGAPAAPAASCCSPAPGKSFAIVSRTKSAKLTRGGALTFSLVSKESGSATATGTISVPGAARVVRFGTRRLTLSAGKRTTVTLALSKRSLHLVRAAQGRGRRLTARIALRATARSGDTASTTLSIRLKG